MKIGRTHLAYKVEEAVDLETGAVVAVTMPEEEMGDTKTMAGTLIMAREEVEAVAEVQVREVVADKGYHSRDVVLELKQQGLRSYVAEPEAEKSGCGFGGLGGNGCSASGANSWNGRLPISSSPADGAESWFVGMRMSASDCWSMGVDSIWVC